MTLGDWGSIGSIGCCILSAIGLWGMYPAIRNWRLNAQLEKFYIRLRIEAGSDDIGARWSFDPHSKDFALAERLVDQGRLHRHYGAMYGFFPDPMQKPGTKNFFFND